MSIVTPGLVLRRRVDKYSAHLTVSAEAKDLIEFVRTTKKGLRVWMMRNSLPKELHVRDRVFVVSSDCIYTGTGLQKPYIEDRTEESAKTDDGISTDQLMGESKW